MFTTYANKYYAQLCYGGPGTPLDPPLVTGLFIHTFIHSFIQILNK